MSATRNGSSKPQRQASKLRAEIDRTRELRANCSRLKQTTEERIRALQDELVEAYSRKARGERTAQKDADRLNREINEARRSIESADAEIKGTLRAEERATEELGQLLARELTTFADEAEQVTREAIAAFEALEPVYRAAEAAWVQAQRAWYPLSNALHEMFKQQTEQAGLYLPAQQLIAASSVARWPLPLASELFPLPREPRPAALEPQGEPEPDDGDEEEDDE